MICHPVHRVAALVLVLLLPAEALACFAVMPGHLRLETVRGIVNEAHEDTPIAGATVEIRTTSAASHEQHVALSGQRTQQTRRVAVTTTAGDGTFKFERLTPGNYVITIESPANYLPASAFLIISPPSEPGTTTPQEAVVELSRGNGPCSTVVQQEPK